jgi:hypothetical protein
MVGEGGKEFMKVKVPFLLLEKPVSPVALRTSHLPQSHGSSPSGISEPGVRIRGLQSMAGRTKHGGTNRWRA